MKRCSFCAEEIQDAAIVCRHCGRDLPKGLMAAPGMVDKKKTSMGVKLFLGFIILVGIGSLLPRPGSQVTSSPQTVSLAAEARFDGTQFTLRNPEQRVWTNIKLEINGPLNGYEYAADALKPGETMKVGAMQFAKSDGTRFNPFHLKPQNFIVYADVDARGTRGVWQGGWK